MKIRILDRILVAVAGLLVLAGCAALAAQLFFGKNVAAWAGRLLADESVRIWLIVALALLLILGVYCVLILFRHRSRHDKFVMQKTENGELSISLKAMESMVQKCLDPHKELSVQSVRLENQKGGLLIRIRGTVAGGVSIPLTVDALQQQIKQYVTACSGVEVKGIRVQIESSGEEAQDAPFAIDPPAAVPLLRSSEKKDEAPEKVIIPDPPKEDTPADVPSVPEEKPSDSLRSAAEAAMEAAETRMKEYEEDMVDERPLHQRIFSTPEEPCIMPLPPEDLNESVCTSSEKTDESEETSFETVPEAEISVPDGEDPDPISKLQDEPTETKSE
jgi:uncharacterized alkaline shock family protein YloU